MSERKPVQPYFHVRPEGAPDIIRPEETTGFLSGWLKSARSRNDKLLWLTRGDKKHPWRSCTIDYDERDVEVLIRLPAIQKSEFHRIPLAQIGIIHCVMPPLHGEVVANGFNRDIINNPHIARLLRVLEIELTGDCLSENRSVLVINQAEIIPPPNEIITDRFFQNIAKIVGLKKQDYKLIYFDKALQHDIWAIIQLCIDKHMVVGRYGQEFSFDRSVGDVRLVPNVDDFKPVFAPPETKYHALLTKRGLGPYDYEETYNLFREDIIRLLFTEDKPSVPIGPKEIREKLSQRYIGSFPDRFPSFKVRIKLQGDSFEFKTNCILSYEEFYRRLQQIADNQLPPFGHISSLHDLDTANIGNYELTMERGTTKVIFFFSRSTGCCSQHHNYLNAQL